jgi:hypothetical protein
VSALLAGAQFILNPLEHRILRLDEAWQIERVELIGTSHADAL